MIQQTSFVGIPLHTRRQRHLLVVGYYLLLLALALFGLWRKGLDMGILIPQVLTLGGLLGGIQMGGPVKYYYGSNGTHPDGSGIQSLNLSGRRPFSPWPGGAPLDEREQAQRDAAHFKAYRIMTVTLIVAGCAYGCVATLADTTWIYSRVPFIIWLMVVYVLSLPQAVLLWTEPLTPVADLIEMPASQAS
jgi:hypothetical protein